MAEEKPAAPALYGADRFFVYLELPDAPDNSQRAALAAIEAAGQPVARIVVRQPIDVWQEFFRWRWRPRWPAR